MKKILIIPATSPGHIIPTFKIARYLYNYGYNLVYLIDQSMKHLVEEQDFQNIICSPDLFVNKGVLSNFDHYEELFQEKALDRISNSTLKIGIKNLSKFEDTIEYISPDCILIDAFFSYNYILLQNKRPIIFLQTMISTYQDILIPPLNSKIHSNNSLFVLFEWVKYKLICQCNIYNFLEENSWGLTKRILKKLNRSFNFNLLNWNKCFHVGIKNISEWVLSPIEFDFPRKKTLPFQRHLGVMVDLERKEIKNTHYENIITQIKDKKIAYCSLGTISLVHNKQVAAFLQKMIQIFSLKKDWELIISCGQVGIYELGIVSSNVHLFSQVPQLDAIKKSNLVITHGGLNTVMECIILGVPMLVFPLNNIWDQNGNAARVVYHKIGLRGDINKITIREINSKIDAILNNPIFKENILKLGKLFQENDKSYEHIIEGIESLMS